MKKNKSTIILIVVFIIGLSLLLYPSISNYWNSFHSSRAVANYNEQVANMDDASIQEAWDAAVAYNKKLLTVANRYAHNAADDEEYNSLLNVAETGVMAYIEIPKIRVELPIYHGVEDKVLQIAAGHIQGSSLPVGGESTHCVLSGHRGLPSAKLFTDLDELAEGDVFILRTLNDTLTYEVDQIVIVEPQDTAELEIKEGEDLCTLVTCTPYGINTHRLLVRGHRVSNAPDLNDTRVTSDAMQIDTMIIAPLIALPVLLGLLGYVLIKYRKKNKSAR